MASKPETDLGINSWLEEELYQEYLHDHRAVDESWKEVFQNASPPAPAAPRPAPSSSAPATAAGPAAAPDIPGDWTRLKGAPARIAQNMAASVSVPLATSQRTIPVKVMDENRRIINQHRTLVGRSKVSFTHLIGWSIIRALEQFPNLNNAYAERNGEPFRVVRKQINLGVAVDVAGKDGVRSLLVPNIKDAGQLDFAKYVAAFDDLV